MTISTCKYYSDDINSQYSNAAFVQLPRLTSYTPDIVNAARLALPPHLPKRLRLQGCDDYAPGNHAGSVPGVR